jgi:archaemetzincin
MNKFVFRAIPVLFGIALFFGCEQNKGEFKFWDSGPTRVGIQPFGKINDNEVAKVKESIEEMYDFEVVILNRRKLPDMAYTEIRYPRYRADSLVDWISNHVPDTVDLVLGLTNKDISITKYKKGTMEIKEPAWQYRDFGIFGLGRVGGNACVVSSYRLHKDASSALFYKRLTRISCHEVGHVLGLHHCPKPNCLMNDANETIKTIDRSTGNLCESCWEKIH